MKTGRPGMLLGFLCAAALIGCAVPELPKQTAPSPELAQPASSQTPTAAPQPSATPVVPDSGWMLLQQGLDQRVLNLNGEEGRWVESVTILRLDPAYFRFDVVYEPGTPKSLINWQTQTAAQLVVNGGFFTENDEATGLIISGGQAFGNSYEGFGGMFAITGSGPVVRSLREEPYDGQEPLVAALQAFPMLLTPSGAVPTEDDGQRARRTVVAQDNAGRIYFMVAAKGHFTLFGLSRFLMSSDLDLERALNLDGGASSGMLLVEPRVFIPALSLLPAVIVVHER